jgi:general secretion pathway protein C
MQTHSLQIWWLRIATFSIAALAAASATYWVLKWSAAAPSAPTAPAVFSPPAQTDPQVVARLLGGGLTAVATTLADSAASHFKLTGVVASRSHKGYALISVDGKPARPYRVGTQVNDTLVLHSVAPRSAALAASLDAPVAFTLELPKSGQP